MQLFYCNSQKNFTKKCFKSTFVMHFSAFQDFQNEILFQYSKISYNKKVNFCELSDILRVTFWTFFLMLEGPSLFSKVHQAMNLTLLVRNTSCTVYEEKINCEMAKLAVLLGWQLQNSPQDFDFFNCPGCRMFILCLATVANNSYRFWADLHLDGNV